MMLRLLAGAALALCAPVMANAQSGGATPSSNVVVPPPSMATRPAYRLAQLLNPLVCFQAEPGSPAADQLAQLIAENEDYRSLEPRYPGISAHVTAVLIDQTQRTAQSSAETLWHALAPLYDDAMDATQIAQAVAFMQSPIGARMATGMCVNSDIRPLAAVMNESPDGQVPVAALDAMTRQAAESLNDEPLTVREQASLNWFMRTDAFRIMSGLRPRVLEVGAEIANRPSPELDAELEHSLDRFMAAASKPASATVKRGIAQ